MSDFFNKLVHGTVISWNGMPMLTTLHMVLAKEVYEHSGAFLKDSFEYLKYGNYFRSTITKHMINDCASVRWTRLTETCVSFHLLCCHTASSHAIFINTKWNTNKGGK